MPEDFSLLCKLGSRMVSRPTTVCISHAEALQQAHDLAVHWLCPTDDPMDIVEGRTSRAHFPYSHPLASKLQLIPTL